MKRTSRRIILVIGLILIVLGIASLFVPVPQEREHGFEVGNFEVGVTRDVNEPVDPVISSVIIGVGVGVLLIGFRK